MLTRHGVKNALQLPAIREKGKQTMYERYGADHPMRCDEIKQRQGDTCETRYGVRHALQDPVIRERAKLRRRSRVEAGEIGPWASSLELEFGDWLVGRYGDAAVHRQQWQFGRPIDLYLRSHDVWIQFDGEFWHGLDGHLDVIKATRPYAYENFMSDRQQDEQFAAAGMCLVRVTDREYKRAKKSSDFTDIITKIEAHGIR